jgi:hypothetical protein
MTPNVHWVDMVIVLTLLEGLWLWSRHRRTGRGIAPRDFAFNWASGLALMLALRGAVAAWGMAWVLAWLMVAGAIHTLDLRRRWR